MSTGNGSLNSSIANIALPPQSRATTTASQAGTVASATAEPSQAYDYYSSPEYQQYYQQYYANAYAQQQYAAYYQQQAGPLVDGTSAASAYSAALYGQTQASYLTGAYPSAAAAVVTNQVAVNGTSEVNADDDEDDDDDDPTIAKSQGGKASNTLPYHCNSKMGLNPLIYTNIQQSPYFKNNLFQLKTYHEVIDEIYYNVKHLEPWEKGSRKVSGQTGMCGSVRGVGAGGIISTPFCVLFKLYTLRLTRKQVNGLIRHKDSPFIRGLGFIFIRFTQPPQDLWHWFESYLSDDEAIDPKAGGGAQMTIGEMVRYLLTKPDWFSTLFPRIPIPVQKQIEEKLRQYDEENPDNPCKGQEWNGAEERTDKADNSYYNKQHQRSDSNKYSKYDSRGGRSRSRSRSPTRYQDKRSKKYDDDRRNDYDRSNRHKSDRYH